jgi:hypothetical protein
VKRILLLVSILAAGLMLCSSPALATTFQFNSEISGGIAPAGTPAWLTAVFEDSGLNQVTLTLTATNLTGGEFITEWDFNVSDIRFAGLTAVNPKVQSGQFALPDFSKVMNKIGADGDYGYDIQFLFASANNNGGVKRFTQGDSFQIVFQANGLKAEEFNFLSDPGGASGPHYSAAHVQGIANPAGSETLSGWVAPGNPVPQPATMLFFGTGLIGLAGFGRKKLLKRS